VQPFPGPGEKVQISSNGGAQPRWNKNGKEIFYVSLDSQMMAAPVKLSPDGQSLETGTPAALFPVRIAGGPSGSWSISPRTRPHPSHSFTTGNPSHDLAQIPRTQGLALAEA